MALAGYHVRVDTTAGPRTPAVDADAPIRRDSTGAAPGAVGSTDHGPPCACTCSCHCHGCGRGSGFSSSRDMCQDATTCRASPYSCTAVLEALRRSDHFPVALLPGVSYPQHRVSWAGLLMMQYDTVRRYRRETYR